MKINFNDELKKQIKENFNQVVKEIDTPEFQKKITNWADRFGYPSETVKQKIIEDEMFRCHFIKDPKKQGFYDKLLYTSLHQLKNVALLARNTTKFVQMGEIKKRGPTDNKKNIHFTWESSINQKPHNCYAFQQFIFGTGGSQFNQYNMFKEFIANCKHTDNRIEPYTLFFGIYYGDYFTQDKIDKIKENTAANLYIVTPDELFGFLIQHTPEE
ncbi:MAG: hypothetical protein ACRCTQ_00805 [Brevinemataceae bacterium]